MPIYEYRCQDCNKKSSFFVRSVNSEVNAVCEHCQGERMTRTISRVAYHKSIADIHEQSGGPPGLGDPGLDYYSDPRNIGRGSGGVLRKVRNGDARQRPGKPSTRLVTDMPPEGLDL